MNHSSRRSTFVRDALLATAILASVYVLTPRLQWSVLFLPYYLLVVGFDALEVLFGAPGALRELFVGSYLLGLGAIGAAIVRVSRDATGRSDRVGYGLALAAPFVVLGLLALVVAASALVGTDQREPVWTAGLAGVALLALGGLLAILGDRGSSGRESEHPRRR